MQEVTPRNDLFRLLAALHLLACLSDPLVLHGLCEQLMLDNADMAGSGFMGVCV